MTNYDHFRESKGISNNDMIQAIQTGFPRYSKIQQSMVNNPYKNGVCLLPEAEELLVKRFGAGPGLSISAKPNKSHGNKAKPNRLTVRIDDALLAQLQSAMERLHFATVQDFIEAALAQMCQKYGGAA